MSEADLARLQREQIEADRRYNDALTALDQAVASIRGHALDVADFERLSHALIILLQQITAFVDTKDRVVAADAHGAVERLDRVLDEVGELRTRLNVLQRQARQQPIGPGAPPSVNPTPSAAGGESDAMYVSFEDQFRGSDEHVGTKLSEYLPLFAGASDVVDLGCGRGEFLAALRAAGVPARGVDANGGMVAVAVERGLDVQRADALAFVAALADDSIGGAIATQVVEHLQPSYLIRLLETLARKLRPGAPLVLETINPACWLAFFSSYIRDFTHVKPLHPDTLQYLLRASGFERVSVRYSAPVPDEMKMRHVDLPAAVLTSTDETIASIAQVAHAVNANAAALNGLLFTYQDYAVIGYRA